MDNAVVARAAEIKVLFTYASWRGEMMARGVGQLLTLRLKIHEDCNNAGQVNGFPRRTSGAATRICKSWVVRASLLVCLGVIGPI
jgi:hypothetical protein